MEYTPLAGAHRKFQHLNHRLLPGVIGQVSPKAFLRPQIGKKILKESVSHNLLENVQTGPSSAGIRTYALKILFMYCRERRSYVPEINKSFRF